MYNNNFCNNCGTRGHLFHQCKQPITSTGMIVYSTDCEAHNETCSKAVNKVLSTKTNNIKFLMIRRKDSLGYVDFMRGKYNLNNKSYILNILDEMTIYEREKLLTTNFSTLWNSLWGDYVNNQYKNEKEIAYEKFRRLKSGIIIDGKYINLNRLTSQCKSKWDEPEWGFPKGRRNYMETDIKCALREFEEETGIGKDNVLLVSNLMPYEESFIGSNYKSYKHAYYLARLINDLPLDNSNFQRSEVSKIEWKTCNDALRSIRNYNTERASIIVKINKLISTINISS
jgi:ADP-ribose pyrophosphatase YjhB (NUDIX family)